MGNTICIAGVDMGNTICIMAVMRLSEYIEKIGRNKAAEVFEVTPGAISHWLTGTRRPSHKAAQLIVERTHGLVTFDGIYCEQAISERSA